MYQLTDSQRAKWSRQNVVKEYYALCEEMGLEPGYQDIERQLTERRCSVYVQDHYGSSLKGGTTNMEVVAEGIRMGDLPCIELSIRYIQANVMSWRTGYVRGYMARYLKQAELTEEQKKRLAMEFLSQLETGQMYFEFKEYVKLFRHIGVKPYKESLRKLLKSDKAYIRNAAMRLLAV